MLWWQTRSHPWRGDVQGKKIVQFIRFSYRLCRFEERERSIIASISVSRQSDTLTTTTADALLLAQSRLF